HARGHHRQDQRAVAADQNVSRAPRRTVSGNWRAVALPKLGFCSTTWPDEMGAPLAVVADPSWALRWRRSSASPPLMALATLKVYSSSTATGGCWLNTLKTSTNTSSRLFLASGRP